MEGEGVNKERETVELPAEAIATVEQPKQDVADTIVKGCCPCNEFNRSIQLAQLSSQSLH